MIYIGASTYPMYFVSKPGFPGNSLMSSVHNGWMSHAETNHAEHKKNKADIWSVNMYINLIFVISDSYKL